MSASGNNKAGTRGASAGWGGPAVLNHSPRDNPPRRGPAGEDLKAGGRGRTGAWGENSKEPAGEEVRRAGGTEGSLWKDPGFCSCGNRTPLEDTEQTSQVWLTCSSALSDFQDQRQMHGGQQETTKSNQEVTVTQTRVVTVQVGRHGWQVSDAGDTQELKPAAWLKKSTQELRERDSKASAWALEEWVCRQKGRGMGPLTQQQDEWIRDEIHSRCWLDTPAGARQTAGGWQYMGGGYSWAARRQNRRRHEACQCEEAVGTEKSQPSGLRRSNPPSRRTKEVQWTENQAEYKYLKGKGV